MGRYKNNSGFSLVEIIIVIGVIGILIGIGANFNTSYIQRTRDDRRILDIELLREALGKYQTNQSGGFYPRTLNELVTGNYLLQRPIDPQSRSPNVYVYTAFPITCNNTMGNFCLNYSLVVNLERMGTSYSVRSGQITGTIIP